MFAFVSDMLIECWNKLGFAVDAYDNLTADEMIHVLFYYGTQTDHTDVDAFVCCISSHGDCGRIHGVDNR